MADNKNGNKATIREVRDLLDKLDDEKMSPMKVILTRIETKFDIHLKGCAKYQLKNDEDKEGFISRKLFVSLSTILGLIVVSSTILQSCGVI